MNNSIYIIRFLIFILVTLGIGIQLGTILGILLSKRAEDQEKENNNLNKEEKQ